MTSNIYLQGASCTLLRKDTHKQALAILSEKYPDERRDVDLNVFEDGDDTGRLKELLEMIGWKMTLHAATGHLVNLTHPYPQLDEEIEAIEAIAHLLAEDSYFMAVLGETHKAHALESDSVKFTLTCWSVFSTGLLDRWKMESTVSAFTNFFPVYTSPSFLLELREEASHAQ